MAYRPRGRARVDPENPSAFAICDRCGKLYNHHDLQWQHQWQGFNLFNKRLLVCEDCLDKVSPFLRAIVIPADPQPVFNARIEPYSIDEAGSYDPSPWRVRTAALSTVAAILQQSAGLIPAFAVITGANATLTRALGGITGVLSATGGFAGTAQQIKQILGAHAAVGGCALSFTFGLGVQTAMSAIGSTGGHANFLARIAGSHTATANTAATPVMATHSYASAAATSGLAGAIVFGAKTMPAMSGTGVVAGAVEFGAKVAPGMIAAAGTMAMPTKATASSAAIAATGGSTGTAIFGAKAISAVSASGGAAGTMTAQRPWLPSDYGANVEHWYDLQDATTFTDVGSGVISVLNDKTANAYNLTAAVGKRGTLTYANTNFNGYNTLNFGTNGMGMIAGSAGYADLRSYLLDVDGASATASALNCCGAVMTNHFTIPGNYVFTTRHTNVQPASGDNIHRVNGTEVAHSAGTVTPAGPCTYFFCGRVIDSGQSAVGRFHDNTGGTYCLGNRMSDYARTATGTHFGEFIVTATYLSDADVSLFEGYLAWKYGLQGSLPVGHTYKSARPMVAL